MTQAATMIEQARELAANIMVAMRQARFPKEYADEAHDEFEALTLVPMLLTALQGSAALPSEAMIEAGANTLWERLDLNGHTLDGVKRAATDCYAAMRAATPTAPVQDDDAELITFLRHQSFAASQTSHARAKVIGQRLGEAADRIEQLRFASRLSPTPDTGLIEALRDAREAIASLPEEALGMVVLTPASYDDDGCEYPIRDELLDKIDTALANASPAQVESKVTKEGEVK